MKQTDDDLGQIPVIILTTSEVEKDLAQACVSHANSMGIAGDETSEIAPTPIIGRH